MYGYIFLLVENNTFSTLILEFGIFLDLEIIWEESCFDNACNCYLLSFVNYFFNLIYNATINYKKLALAWGSFDDIGAGLCIQLSNCELSELSSYGGPCLID